MSDTGPEFVPNTPQAETGGHLLRDELPYIAMLLGALVGIVIHELSGSQTIFYWQLVTPAYALICILAGWKQAGLNEGHSRLVKIQAAHWLACFVAMRLLFLPQVSGVINDNATGLTLLTVLALSTVLAGLHLNIWRIAVVGVLLALAVPGLAWLQQSSMLLLLAVVLTLGASVLFFWVRSKLRK
jgi:hypothetical protein